MEGNISNKSPLKSVCNIGFVAILCLAMLLTACKKKPEGEIFVSTNSVTDITENSANCGGTVYYTGAFTIGDCGVCCSEYSLPTISDYYTEDQYGIGSFNSNLKNLKSNTTYYTRAYARTSSGIIYGNQVTFTTEQQTEPEWMSYGDGTFDSRWGLINGGTLAWGVKFTSSMMPDFSRATITKVKVCAGDPGTYTLRIYDGGGDNILTTLTYTISQTGWRTLNVTPNVSFDCSQSLWVTFTVVHNAGEYPAGASPGTNTENARWRNPNNTGWTTELSNGWTDVCWNIQAYLTNEGKGDQEYVLSY